MAVAIQATHSTSGLLKGIDSKFFWLRGLDLNQRPLGYEPNELPGCSTPHFDSNSRVTKGQKAGKARASNALDMIET